MGPRVDSALGGGAGRGRKDSSKAAASIRARNDGGPAIREWQKREESRMDVRGISGVDASGFGDRWGEKGRREVWWGP